MPQARTQVGPGAPWTYTATLADPTQWAFVSASGGLQVNPEFHCEIAVDGQVIASEQGRQRRAVLVAALVSLCVQA